MYANSEYVSQIGDDMRRETKDKLNVGIVGKLEEIYESYACTTSRT